jgi:hypothetical protein
MADYSYILFNKSPAQLRLVGARGGRAYGRNQRARRALTPTPPRNMPLGAASRETTAQAIAVLDAQFPWLRHTENPQPMPLRLRGTVVVISNLRSVPPGPAMGSPTTASKPCQALHAGCPPGTSRCIHGFPIAGDMCHTDPHA